MRLSNILFFVDLSSWNFNELFSRVRGRVCGRVRKCQTHDLLVSYLSTIVRYVGEEELKLPSYFTVVQFCVNIFSKCSTISIPVLTNDVQFFSVN